MKNSALIFSLALLLWSPSAPAVTLVWNGYLAAWQQPVDDCHTTINHQAIHLPIPAVISITGVAYKEAVFPYLSRGLIGDASWVSPLDKAWIGPWNRLGIPRTSTFSLAAGDYILSVTDLESYWYPDFGLKGQSGTDYCVSNTYDVTISGDFIPTGRWEGNEEAFPTEFTYTAQESIPEPVSCALVLAAAVLGGAGRRRRTRCRP